MYNTSVFLVGSLHTDFRNFSGHCSFKLHHHDKVAHHGGVFIVIFFKNHFKNFCMVILNQDHINTDCLAFIKKNFKNLENEKIVKMHFMKKQSIIRLY